MGRADRGLELLHFSWIDQREVDWFRTRSEGIRVVEEAFDANGIAMPDPAHNILSTRRKDDQKESVPSRRATAAGEPTLELDISPDPHLDRVVARDRAEAETDLLDPGAPHE